jgi:hypothetical protein
MVHLQLQHRRVLQTGKMRHCKRMLGQRLVATSLHTLTAMHTGALTARHNTTRGVMCIAAKALMTWLLYCRPPMLRAVGSQHSLQTCQHSQHLRCSLVRMAVTPVKATSGMRAQRQQLQAAPLPQVPLQQQVLQHRSKLVQWPLILRHGAVATIPGTMQPLLPQRQ